MQSLECITKIHWHDSPISNFVLDFNTGQIILNFEEFGTLKIYQLKAENVNVKKMKLEKQLDITDCEIGHFKLNQIENKIIEISLGIYSPMNGFAEIIFTCSSVVLK